MLDRLSCAKIDVISLRVIDEKTAEITLSAKDRAKYFAICKNMWYNSLKRVGGVLSPFFRLALSPAYACLLVVFFVLAFLADGIYLGIVYKGDAIFYRAAIEEVFAEAGINKYSFFDEGVLQAAESSIGQKTGASFIKIEKSGNRAVITAYRDKKAPKKIESISVDVRAEERLRILKITVYSGTACLSAGDIAEKGDVIIGAYEVLKDGSVIFAPVIACVTAEKTFKYEYACTGGVSDDAKRRAVAAAKFALGDKTVLKAETEEGANGFTVTLYYEEVIIGSGIRGG